jgi:hypothetical protein
VTPFVRATRGAVTTLGATATDDDVPSNTLAFSLDAGSPGWAALNPATGLLTLQPPLDTPLGLYQLALRVTDNGVPPMTDAHIIDVLVTDDLVAPVSLVPTGSVWRYFDQGTDQGIAWRGTYFDDAFWSRGPGPLGYRTSNEVTVVSYGPSSSSKYVTTYFRRPLFVPETTAIQDLTLRIVANDGVVVYVNGGEVLRDNLPSSTITYTNFSTRRINGATNILIRTLDPAILFDGLNIIAAEIHQNAANGADILFDLSLTGSAFVPRDAPIQIMPSGNGLALVWPAQASLLSLCSAINLMPPIVWTPVDLFGSPSVQLAEPYCILDLGVPTNQTLFFRLQTP